jgi:hypothetical protein
MPKKKDNYVDWRDDWRNSRAKKQLIKDLENGFIPLCPTEMSAEQGLKLHPLYEEVNLPKFKRNFEALRRSIWEEKARASRDSEGFTRDTERRSADAAASNQQTGKKRWDGSKAQAWLQQDMQQKHHEQAMPMYLWESRPEYKEFDLDSFRNQIYVEERRQKRVAKYKQDRNQALCRAIQVAMKYSSLLRD